MPSRPHAGANEDPYPLHTLRHFLAYLTPVLGNTVGPVTCTEVGVESPGQALTLFSEDGPSFCRRGAIRDLSEKSWRPGLSTPTSVDTHIFEYEYISYFQLGDNFNISTNVRVFLFPELLPFSYNLVHINIG